jgi:hypothetical protein
MDGSASPPAEPVPEGRRPVWAWLVIAGAGVVALAAVLSAAVAWAQPLPRLDRAGARAFTEDALVAAGFAEDEVEVRGIVRESVYPEADAGDPQFEVWITRAVVDGTPVRLWVDRDGAQAVQIDDHTEIGPLLSLRQFRTLDGHGEHPGADDRQRRNLWISGAAVLLVLLAGAAVAVVWRAGRDQPA